MATFTWTGGTIGFWNDPTAWSGPGGSPRTGDLAIVPGADGTLATVDVINGPGNAGTVLVTGGVVLNGAFGFSDAAIGTTGALNVGTGDSLQASVLTEAANSSLVVNGGTVTVDDTMTSAGQTLFRNGAVIRIAGDYVVTGGAVTLDATSSLNIGPSGSAMPGTLVVDAGHSLTVLADPPFFGNQPGTFSSLSFLNNGTITGSGRYQESFGHADLVFVSGTNNGVMSGVMLTFDATGTADVVRFTNNGTIFSGASTVLNALDGPGTIAISDGQGLVTVGSKVSGLVDFSRGAGAVSFESFRGDVLTFQSFGTDDVVFLNDRVTAASYTPTGAHAGLLSLTTAFRGTLDVAFLGDYAADPSLEFATGTVLHLGPNGLFIAPVCFGAGTRIATTRGAVAVEELCMGDRAVVAAGEASRPITWIGHRTIDFTRHPTGAEGWPICVSAGAFAPHVPERDLYLSPNHAIFAEGVLIPIKHLVNGSSIARVRCDRIVYWHVELDRHDVLLAEGLPAESYLDSGDRGFFANSGSVVTLHPAFPLLIRDGGACAPLAVAGAEVERVRALLARRAAAQREAPRRRRRRG